MKLLLLILSTLSVQAQFGAPSDPAFWKRRSPYLADNAVFDGFTQYMFKQATYGGAVTDSPGFTLSCWVKRGTNDAAAGNMILAFANGSSADRCNVYIGADNKINVSAFNSVGTPLLAMVGTNTITVSGGWTHILVAVNLNAGITNSKIFVNGVLDATNAQTRVSGTIDFVGTNYRYWIGRYNTASAFWNGALSELWFDLNYFDDPTLFINNGCPAYLGENGELPHGGVQPAWYFKGSNSLFNVVLGAASASGNFGITNGPLAATNRICL